MNQGGGSVSVAQFFHHDALQATGKWKSFTRSLSDGTNTSEFIRSVNGAPDAPLKLIWGQEGEVSSYDDGDTLLIDDIKITVTE